jgi:mono/diheme cytochrome c family protein
MPGSFLLIVPTLALAAGPPQAHPPLHALVEKHCVTCHGAKRAQGGR